MAATKRVPSSSVIVLPPARRAPARRAAPVRRTAVHHARRAAHTARRGLAVIRRKTPSFVGPGLAIMAGTAAQVAYADKVPGILSLPGLALVGYGDLMNDAGAKHVGWGAQFAQVMNSLGITGALATAIRTAGESVKLALANAGHGGGSPSSPSSTPSAPTQKTSGGGLGDVVETSAQVGEVAQNVGSVLDLFA